jgi:hypothetical protein
MKKLLIIFCLLLFSAASATASTITIASETTAAGFWQRAGTTGKIRFWAAQSFRASNGTFVPGGNFGDKNAAFLVVNITVNSDKSITIPAITNLLTTTDSINVPNVTYLAKMYDARDAEAGDFDPSEFALPPSLGSTTTWADITLYNNQHHEVPRPGTLDADQILSLINAIPTATISNEVSIENYASLTAALSAIASNKKTLIISVATPVSSSTSIPANVTLKFTGQGELVVSSGQTLTVLGPIEAGSGRPIFTGTGTTSFAGNSYLSEIPAVWLGVTCDMSTDDAPFYQRGVNAVGDGQILATPDSCRMRWATQVTVNEKTGIAFKFSDVEDGYTHSTNNVTWAGATNTYMMRITNSGTLTIKGGRFLSAVAGTGGLDIDRTGSPTTTPTSIIVRAMTFNFTQANTNSVGVRVAFTSNQNLERMQIRNNTCAFSPVSGSMTDPTNLTRGTCFKVGDVSGATGFNVLNEDFENNYWFGVTYGLDFANAGTLYAKSNQSNYASVDYKLYPFSQSSNQIISQRTEGARQLLVMETGIVSLDSNEIGYGGWDATGTNPVIKVNGGVLNMKGTSYVGSHSAGVKYVVGTSSARLNSNSNSYLDQTQTCADFKTFGLGAHSDGDNINCGGGTTLNNGATTVYPGATGGQSTMSLLRSYNYYSTAFYDAIIQHTDSSSRGNTIEFGSSHILLPDVMVTKTITGGGTTGAQTINKTGGSVNFAAGASTLVITNSLVTASSLIVATAAANDATCSVKDVEAASGSFTIRMTANCTAETRVNWLVLN